MRLDEIVAFVLDGAIYCPEHAPDDASDVMLCEMDGSEVCDTPHGEREDGTPIFEKILE